MLKFINTRKLFSNCFDEVQKIVHVIVAQHHVLYILPSLQMTLSSLHLLFMSQNINLSRATLENISHIHETKMEVKKNCKTKHAK